MKRVRALVLVFLISGAAHAADPAEALWQHAAFPVLDRHSWVRDRYVTEGWGKALIFGKKVDILRGCEQHACEDGYFVALVHAPTTSVVGIVFDDVGSARERWSFIGAPTEVQKSCLIALAQDNTATGCS